MECSTGCTSTTTKALTPTRPLPTSTVTSHNLVTEGGKERLNRLLQPQRGLIIWVAKEVGEELDRQGWKLARQVWTRALVVVELPVPYSSILLQLVEDAHRPVWVDTHTLLPLHLVAYRKDIMEPWPMEEE